LFQQNFGKILTVLAGALTCRPNIPEQLAGESACPTTGYHGNVPTALVLSAGGMYAAWEVGVWKALREHIAIDLVVGASAGAWNGWAIAGGATVGELERDWLDPATGRILAWGPHSTGLLRPEALHRKSRDLCARYRPRIPFGLTVVEVPRLRTRLVRDCDVTWQHLAASCTIPFCFPPVRIGRKYYVDGGLRGALPLWAAEAMGATRAIAVNSLTGWPFRGVHALLGQRRAGAALEVIRIEPSEPLGRLRDSVVWSGPNITRWFALGERDGTRALRSITSITM
jgi:NTE family protein